MNNSAVLERPKLTEVATTRITDEWMQLIDMQTHNRAEWLRKAIEEKLMKCDEFNFSHNQEGESKNTWNTTYSPKNTNVFNSIAKFFSKPQTQKKTDCHRSFSAYSSQG